MSASNKAKLAGLDSLAEVTRLSGVSKETLGNWSKNKPELFDVVLDGCFTKKTESEFMEWINGKGHCQCLTCESKLTK